MGKLNTPIVGEKQLMDALIQAQKEIEKLKSRPTCTANERAFLDEIREKGRSTTHNQHITISTDRGTYYELKQSDFKANLKELVQ